MQKIWKATNVPLSIQAMSFIWMNEMIISFIKMNEMQSQIKLCVKKNLILLPSDQTGLIVSDLHPFFLYQIIVLHRSEKAYLLCQKRWGKTLNEPGWRHIFFRISAHPRCTFKKNFISPYHTFKNLLFHSVCIPIARSNLNCEHYSLSWKISYYNISYLDECKFLKFYGIMQISKGCRCTKSGKGQEPCVDKQDNNG